MVLDEALDSAEKLCEALAGEVAAARGERHLLRSLDSQALLRRAAARAEFQAQLARLEGRLHDALASAAGRLGIGTVTIAALAEREPRGASALSRTFGEVRALAAALAELDRLNQILASRALRLVRSYVEAITPSPGAYDRRGGRAAITAATVVSSRV
jgi:glutathione S-transferase